MENYAIVLCNYPLARGNIAVCKGADGWYYWADIPAEFAEPGSALQQQYLHPLKELAVSDRMRVREMIAMLCDGEVAADA